MMKAASSKVGGRRNREPYEQESDIEQKFFQLKWLITKDKNIQKPGLPLRGEGEVLKTSSKT